jgi:hypothetical protein
MLGGTEHGHCSQLCLQWWRVAGVFAGENNVADPDPVLFRPLDPGWKKIGIRD